MQREEQGGQVIPIFSSGLASLLRRGGLRIPLERTETAGGEVNVMRLSQKATLISRPRYMLTHFQQKALTAMSLLSRTWFLRSCGGDSVCHLRPASFLIPSLFVGQKLFLFWHSGDAVSPKQSTHCIYTYAAWTSGVVSCKNWCLWGSGTQSAASLLKRTTSGKISVCNPQQTWAWMSFLNSQENLLCRLIL